MRVIALVCALGGAATFSIGAFAALLPEIGRSAHLPDWQLGALAGAFGFARMTADVPVGLFITHQLRRALLLSPLLLAVGVACLVSGGPFPVLVLGRAVMGVGHALGAVAGLTAILRYDVGGRLAAALGAFELSAMVAILLGTTTLGLLPERLPWNLALLVTCAPQLAGIVIAPLVVRALPPEPATARGPLLARRPAGASVRRRLAMPVVLAFAAGGVVAVAYSTLDQFVIPLRGAREFGLERAGIARLLMIAQACDIACLLPAGVLADRLGTRRVLGTMLLVFSLAVTLLAFGGFALVVAGCVLYGVGMAAWTLPLSVLRGATAPDRIGWRTALYRVGVDAGIFLGPFLSGVLSRRAPGLVPALLAVALATIGAALLVQRPRA